MSSNKKARQVNSNKAYQGREFTITLEAPTMVELEHDIKILKRQQLASGYDTIKVLEKKPDADGIGYVAIIYGHNFNPFKFVKSVAGKLSGKVKSAFNKSPKKAERIVKREVEQAIEAKQIATDEIKEAQKAEATARSEEKEAREATESRKAEEEAEAKRAKEISISEHKEAEQAIEYARHQQQEAQEADIALQEAKSKTAPTEPTPPSPTEQLAQSIYETSGELSAQQRAQQQEEQRSRLEQVELTKAKKRLSPEDEMYRQETAELRSYAVEVGRASDFNKMVAEKVPGDVLWQNIERWKEQKRQTAIAKGEAVAQKKQESTKERIGRIAAIVSTRTPLNAGDYYFLMSMTSTEPEQRKNLERVQKAAQHLRKKSKEKRKKTTYGQDIKKIAIESKRWSPQIKPPKKPKRAKREWDKYSTSNYKVYFAGGNTNPIANPNIPANEIWLRDTRDEAENKRQLLVQYLIMKYMLEGKSNTEAKQMAMVDLGTKYANSQRANLALYELSSMDTPMASWRRPNKPKAFKDWWDNSFYENTTPNPVTSKSSSNIDRLLSPDLSGNI